jgi:FkbM family methyltransferase
MAGRRRRFKVCGRSISVDGAYFSGARELYARGVYFAFPGFSIKNTDVVVDLGANVGLFTVLAATMAAKVIAVEAQSLFIEEMFDNVKENGCEGVVDIEFGLVGGRTGVFSNAGSIASASHFALSPPVLTMSQIIERHKLERIHFLKIDVEGSEFDLLTNDNEWLERVEKIAMEVHSDFGNVNILASTLSDCGFVVSFVNNGGRVVSTIPDASGYVFAMRPTN